MTTDGDQRAMERAMASGGVVVFLVLGTHGAVLTWGRPARQVALAAAVTFAVTVAYLHLIRFSASRPLRWGAFRGLSWADFYRVMDTLARGEAVTEHRLVQPALSHVEQLQRTARLGLVAAPLFVASFLPRLTSGDLSGRGLADRLLTLTFIAAISLRSFSRLPGIRQGRERTLALHLTD